VARVEKCADFLGHLPKTPDWWSAAYLAQTQVANQMASIVVFICGGRRLVWTIFHGNLAEKTARFLMAALEAWSALISCGAMEIVCR
jgi:hypothetical protein